ncbi:MAG: tRNA (guanosine(46)-N7)-methyltransferase TrmB [Bacillota bacterium]
MRLRHVKNASKQIDNHPEYILSIGRKETYLLNNAFKDKQPLVLEIGAGKGQFCHSLAKNTPNINVLAIERFDSVIVRALERVLVDPLKNLYLVRMDAEQLIDCINDHSVEKMYLNFSDPWPKVKHEKRRLTHSGFLAMYETLLVEGGEIEFKTDNRALFEYSVKSMNNYGMIIKHISLDVHADDDPMNIVTEFEERFSKDGPIYKILASFEEAKK